MFQLRGGHQNLVEEGVAMGEENFHTDSGHGFLFAVELGVGISVID